LDTETGKGQIMQRREFLAAAASAAALATASVRAQPAYPAKPIKFVIPFTAGSSTDIMGRTIAERMAESTTSRVWRGISKLLGLRVGEAASECKRCANPDDLLGLSARGDPKQGGAQGGRQCGTRGSGGQHLGELSANHENS
jgi:hypothetical protein